MPMSLLPTLFNSQADVQTQSDPCLLFNTAAPTQAPTTAPTGAPTQAPTAALTGAPTQVYVNASVLIYGEKGPRMVQD